MRTATALFASAALLLTAHGALGQTAAPKAVAGATVHISARGFEPSSVRLKPGEGIDFVNDDDEAHTVTADDKSFDSGYLAKGDHWRTTFAAAGHFPYACTYHPRLRGTVIVAGP